jgi:transposase-like protein
MPGDHDAGAVFLFVPLHRPQPGLQAAVIGLNSVVGVPLGAVPGRLEQVVQHRQGGQGAVGDNLSLDRSDLGRPDGPFEEAAGSGWVPTCGHEHIDDLAERRCAAAVRVQTRIMRTCHPRPAAIARSAFAGFCFPPEVIVLAVRWYLRFGLSFRDVEELLAERGIQVDHVTIFRWVQRFTPLLAEAARPCRHGVGDRWQVDETYVKVAGRWRSVYRAIDQFGQVIDVFVSPRRDVKAARRFFERAIGTTKVTPVEVTTDQAPVYPAVLDELLPAAWHRTDRYANNHIEADHGRLKARLGPMRGLKQDRSARVVIAGHALVQNVRRGHYELAVEAPVNRRVAVAFDELALVI